jgi:hypothetical protein
MAIHPRFRLSSLHHTHPSVSSLSPSLAWRLGTICRNNTSYAKPLLVSLPGPAIIAAQPLASLFVPSSHHRIGKLHSCLRPRLPPNRCSSVLLRPNGRRQTQEVEQTSASLACERVANRSRRHDQECGRRRCRFQGVMMEPGSVRRLAAARESPNGRFQFDQCFDTM